MPPQRIHVEAQLPGALGRLAALPSGPEVRLYPLGGDLLVRTDARADHFTRACSEAGLDLGPDARGNGSFVLPGQADVIQLVADAEEAGAHLMPPILLTRGAARFEFVVLAPARPAAVVRALPGGRLVAKRAIASDELAREGFAARFFAEEMTPRQAEVIVAAIELGYYDNPRSVTTAQIARSLGRSRSTVEEQLRRAEGKVITSAAPVLRVRAGKDRELDGGESSADVLARSVRWSAELGLWIAVWLRGNQVEQVKMLKRRPGDDGALEVPDHPVLARLLDQLATPGPGSDTLDDVPIHLEVTPFEAKVLAAIRAIPPGEVRTYGQLAAAVGNPKAARAVGTVCAKNPVPLLIPCHRVVPANGGLGNYSGGGGARTKARLLAREGARGDETA